MSLAGTAGGREAMAAWGSVYKAGQWTVTGGGTWLPGEVVKRTTPTVTIASSTLTTLFRAAAEINEPWPSAPPNHATLTPSAPEIVQNTVKHFNLAALKVGDFACKIILAPFILAN